MEEQFAERLNKALKIKNMSQSQLVSRTGIGKSTISQYLSGKYKAKQDNISKIADVLNVSPSWLMGIDNSYSAFSNNTDIDIASNLKKFMNEKECTISSLAEYCRVKEDEVSEWVDGSKEPTINYVQSICKCLGIKKSELLGLNKDPSDNGFVSIDEAMQFIIKSPVVSAYGGYDIEKMSEEEIIDFANELAEMFKVMAKRHQK